MAIIPAMHYAGGKGKCFQHLINLMPPHSTYIESHLGGGAVLRHKKIADRNIGIDIDPKVVNWWRSNILGQFEIVHADALGYLQQYPFCGNELIYADPPYPLETRRQKRIYTYEYDHKDHEALLTCLRKIPCMVAISSYDNELYNDMLSDWRKVNFFAKTHSDRREECVWLNFSSPKKLHDTRYLGATFRERQSLKRRQNRLKSRIQRMDTLERNELISWITTTYSC